MHGRNDSVALWLLHCEVPAGGYHRYRFLEAITGKLSPETQKVQTSSNNASKLQQLNIYIE